MRATRWLLSMLVWIVGCAEPNATSAGTTPEAPPPTLRIATFNIQVFGRTKASKPEVLSRLAQTIGDYDVVAVQEVRDSSQQAPRTLLDALHRELDRNYALLLSPRTGREPDDRASQEQFAVYYDADRLESIAGDRLFDDSAHDLFQREPYLVHLKTRHGAFSFVLIDVHTRPERAVAEIGALDEVFRWAREVYPGEDNVIALGDYNAGCRYATPAQLDRLALRSSDYVWIVPDDSDSNVAAGSACAYDRIVVTASAERAYNGRWGVDRAFSDPVVSDHWPVWAEFEVHSR
ncbi:MAG TPA: endonuclease/exonuclease/phosphatase family protein [Polyangiales bacterium]|nr:endonuclease/exonuclease/phosphatase family protein [Polyangiales bacterium]